MSEDTGRTLLFPGRRTGGHYLVTDEQGTVVARISSGWTMTSFSVTDADDRPLASAAATKRGFGRSWRATLPDGSALLTLTPGLFSIRATAELADGTELTVRGNLVRRAFAVTSADGTEVLAAAPRTVATSPRPFDYAVTQPQPVLSLPAVLTIVQIWRSVRQNESAAVGSPG